MSRIITVEAKDGENAYTLARDAEANTAKLTIKGELTPKLARGLVEDLGPLAGVKKRAPAARTRGAAPGAVPGGLDLKAVKADADPRE